MRIEFKLTGDNKEELNLADEFCKSLVLDIKNDILRNVNYDKLDMYEEGILTARWINWDIKPRSINMRKLVNYIVRNIICKSKRRHRYVIYINPTVLLSGSLTPIDKVARFLDKGNEIYNGTFFMSRTFMKYRANIERYWRSYVSIRLKRVSVSEVILIK